MLLKILNFIHKDFRGNWQSLDILNIKSYLMFLTLEQTGQFIEDGSVFVLFRNTHSK
jgi:hypothetical protein